jgi:SAM-dependent methyltransferase
MRGLARRVANRLRRLIAGDPFRRFHARLAREFLRGNGIEVGALHNPVPVGRAARVRYVDRMAKPDLLLHYPDLDPRRLVDVDVVDDGERLMTVPDGSQDFVVANHFLEHCQDPIGTLGQFFRVLKPGGVLYAALPDKRYTFDRPRPVSPLAHLWDDHRHGPGRSRRAHYEEFVAAAEGLSDPEAVRDRADHYLRHDYSIHFHVWTQAEMLELLLAVRGRLGFDFELVRKHQHEVIFVLRKHDPPAAAVARSAA